MLHSLHKLRVPPRRTSRGGRRRAYIIQANPVLPGIAAHLLRSYALVERSLEVEWDIEVINYDRDRYELFRDALTGGGSARSASMVQALYERFLAAPPDLVAFSSYSWNQQLFVHLADSIRSWFPDALLVLGGLGPFGHEEAFLRKHSEFDAVVFGEGERPMADILEQISGGNTALEGVKGVVRRAGDEIVTESPAEPIVCLDDIPSPVIAGCYEGVSPGSLVMLQTTRGCPMRCAFCLMPELDFVKRRAFSVDYVKAEIDWCIDHDLSIMFADAIFHVDVERTNTLLEHILRRDRGRITAAFEIFVEILDESTMELMGELNRRGILDHCQIGLQSIEPATQKYVRRPFRFKRFDEKLDKLQAETENATAIDLIYGLPGDTYETFKSGVDYVFEKQPLAMLLNHCQVISGTQQEREVERFEIRYEKNTGFVLSNETWSSGDLRRGSRFATLAQLLYSVRAFPFRVLLVELSRDGYADFVEEVLADPGLDVESMHPAEALEAALRVFDARVERVATSEPEDSGLVPRLNALLVLCRRIFSIPAAAHQTEAPGGASQEDYALALSPSVARVGSSYDFSAICSGSSAYRRGELLGCQRGYWSALAVCQGGRSEEAPPRIDFIALSSRQEELFVLAERGALSWEALVEEGYTRLTRTAFDEFRKEMSTRGLLRPASAPLGA